MDIIDIFFFVVSGRALGQTPVGHSVTADVASSVDVRKATAVKNSRL